MDEENDYPWQRGKTIAQRQEAMDNRRSEMLENRPESPDIAWQREWLHLLQERDRTLRQLIDQQQKSVRDELLENLHQLLEDLRTMPFQPQEKSIQTGLAYLHKHVSSYVKIKRQRSASAPPAPPPPPPPPPPPVLPPAAEKNPETSRPKPNRSCHSPGAGCHTDVVSMIRSRDCRRSLKPTNCRRSPGLTPAPTKRRYSSTDAGDLITMGLQKKFKKLFDASSPAPQSETSFGSPLPLINEMGEENEKAVSSTPKGPCPCDVLSPGKENEGSKLQSLLLQQTF